MKDFTIATLLAILVAVNIGAEVLASDKSAAEADATARGNTGAGRHSEDVLLLAAASAGNTGV